MSETYTTYGVGPDKHADELHALREDVARLREALEEAGDAICSEYCGAGPCHKKCMAVKAALDAERHASQCDLESLGLKWDAEKRALQTQLTQLQSLVRAKEAAYEKILLSRERLEREVRGYPPVDNEGIPMVWEEPVGWVKRTLDATMPARGQVKHEK